MNEEHMITMDLTLIGQLHLEVLEQYQRTPKNKQRRKVLIKQLIKELEPEAERDFNKMFKLDEETLLSVQQNYEYAVKSFAIRNVPDKVIMSQLLAAYDKDPQGVESSVHRILKKK